MAESEGGGIAVNYEDLGRGSRAELVEVIGEGVDELAFGAVAVEADVEGLVKLKVPLGEGARVEGVEEGDGGLMWVRIGTDLVVILFVGEDRKGGEGVV